MAWTARLRAALAQPQLRPRWILETVPMGSTGLSGRWRICSEAGLGGPALIAPGGVRTQPAEVSIRAWTSTAGAWSVQVSGDDRGLLRVLQRGQIVRLRIGFPGWAEQDFEPIAIGQVWQYGGGPRSRTLQMRDLLSALVCRNTTTGSELPLFASCASSTTVASAYAAGDSSIQVAATTGFERQGGPSGSGPGMLRITPTTGAPFYVTYTGTATSPTRFTGLSAAGLLGTTARAAAVGKAVEEIVYMDDHPAAAAARVLRSSGSFLATGYDTLPHTWGFALPVELVDAEDIADTIAITTPAAGAAEWDVWASQAQTVGIAWLEQLLAPAGLWLASRQGRITVRAAVDPYSVKRWSNVKITEADICAEGLTWQAWDPSTPQEYASEDVASGSLIHSVTNETLGTLPAEKAEYRSLPYVWRDASDWRTEVGGRLAPWACRIPERVDLTCRGWRLAALAPGEVVELTCDLLQGRRASAPYEGQRAMVTSVAPEWAGASTRLSCAVLPDWTGELP